MTEPGPDDPPNHSDKACPFCGETIKAVAVRCKHCQADLSAPDFDRGARAGALVPVAKTNDAHQEDGTADFERRFLDYAFSLPAGARLTTVAVAHALKLPIAVCEDRLEALAAADSIHRDVDDAGAVFYTLPRHALVPAAGHGPSVPARHLGPGALLFGHNPNPREGAAIAGLAINVCFPGLGSIVAGRPYVGAVQLALLAASFPLLFVYLLGIPVAFTVWLWSIATGIYAVREAQAAPPNAE